MGIFALEDNQELFTEEVTDQEIDETVASNAVEITDLSDTSNQVTNGVEVQDTLLKMDEAQTPEEKIEIATEHLLRTVGYTKPFSMESFNTDLNSNLQVAQEGFFGRIINGIQRMFTSNKQMISQSKKALANLKANGARLDLIKEPGWGRHLCYQYKDVIDGSDVIKQLTAINTIFGNNEVLNILKELRNTFNQLNNEVLKSTFTMKEGTIERMDEMEQEVSKTLDKVQLLIDSAVNYADKAYPDFQPLDTTEADKVFALLTDIIQSTNLMYKTWNDTQASIYSGTKASNYKDSSTDNQYVNVLVAAVDKSAEMARPDKQMLKRVAHRADKIMVEIAEYYHQSEKTVHAAYKYLVASSK